MDAARPTASLVLALASARSLEPLLRAAVDGLAEQGAALARVWLLEPGPRPRVLHLAASAGRPSDKHNPEPSYPLEARRRRQHGTVLLSVAVSAAGRAESIAVARSSGFPASTPPHGRRSGLGLRARAPGR